jgi:hypothetical protein
MGLSSPLGEHCRSDAKSGERLKSRCDQYGPQIMPEISAHSVLRNQPSRAGERSPTRRSDHERRVARANANAQQMFDLSTAIERGRQTRRRPEPSPRQNPGSPRTPRVSSPASSTTCQPSTARSRTATHPQRKAINKLLQKIVDHLSDTRRKDLVAKVQTRGLYKYSLALAAPAHSIGLALSNPRPDSSSGDGQSLRANRGIGQRHDGSGGYHYGVRPTSRRSNGCCWSA